LSPEPFPLAIALAKGGSMRVCVPQSKLWAQGNLMDRDILPNVALSKRIV